MGKFHKLDYTNICRHLKPQRCCPASSAIAGYWLAKDLREIVDTMAEGVVLAGETCEKSSAERGGCDMALIDDYTAHLANHTLTQVYCRKTTSVTVPKTRLHIQSRSRG